MKSSEETIKEIKEKATISFITTLDKIVESVENRFQKQCLIIFLNYLKASIQCKRIFKNRGRAAMKTMLTKCSYLCKINKSIKK